MSVIVTAFFVLGLVFATSLEALRPLCGGRRATIASDERTVRGTRGPDTILGGPGDNRIHGGRGNDTICGGRGRDTIHGGRGKDTLDGKKHADRVYGGRGSDEVDGGAGRDRVRGDYGNDVVRGGPGARDLVDGEMGDDVVEGGRGNFDLVIGGVGRDRIDGGPGAHDIASYLSAGGAVAVDLERGLVTGAERERLRRIDTVLTASEADAGSRGLAIAGSGGSDDVLIDFRRHRYVVSGLEATPFRLRGSRMSSIVVSLGAGDDRIDLGRTLPRGVSFTIDGGPGRDRLRGGLGADVLYGGDDRDPDRLAGGGGRDVLYGVNILHPRRPSGAAVLLGGGGSDLMVGGQPCDGDLFRGGPGEFDSASFARVRNGGTVVRARIGGRVVDPGVACRGGRIAGSTEKIEGSPGPDVLLGSAGPDVLLGRGGRDLLGGGGGEDRCIGGGGRDGARRCEYVR